MAMHPDGSRVYLVPTDGSTIKILGTATHTIAGTIPGAGQGGLFPVDKWPSAALHPCSPRTDGFCLSWAGPNLLL